MFFKDKLRLIKLPVSRILPNPSQPRKVFREEELQALAQSIQENGLLQPVTVRRENGAYYLIAGERRLRACQRKDLHMFEQASALVNLLREWQITQEEAAKRLGISQSYLANKLRLLKLSPEEQNEILQYELTERHARALLRVDDPALREKILRQAGEKHLNVSQTEELVTAALAPKQEGRKP